MINVKSRIQNIAAPILRMAKIKNTGISDGSEMPVFTTFFFFL